MSIIIIIINNVARDQEGHWSPAHVLSESSVIGELGSLECVQGRFSWQETFLVVLCVCTGMPETHSDG